MPTELTTIGRHTLRNPTGGFDLHIPMRAGIAHFTYKECLFCNMEYILKLQVILASLESQHPQLTGEAKRMNADMIRGIQDVITDLKNELESKQNK